MSHEAQRIQRQLQADEIIHTVSQLHDDLELLDRETYQYVSKAITSWREMKIDTPQMVTDIITGCYHKQVEQLIEQMASNA